MSIKSWAAAVGLCATILVAPQASASDHNDGAAVKQDPSTDIADLYAWMSPGAAGPNRMYMIMTVNPAANKTTSKFSTTAVYVFHTRAKAAYTDTSTTTEINVMCTFDAAQTIECWAGDDEYVKGDASKTTGISSTSGRLRVFAGPRNDPAFWNFTQGINAIFTDLKTTQPARDASMCATNISMTTRGKLATPPNTDDFRTQSVLALVVSIDKGLVSSASRPIVSVWGSTNRKVN